MSRNRKAPFSSKNYPTPKKTKPNQYREYTNEDIVVTPNIKKTFHLKDLKEVDALTEAQGQAFAAWADGQNLVLRDFAGTGKTFLALTMALECVLDPKTPQKKIVIIRSTAQGRDQGFLPGDIDEKCAPFEATYSAILDELFTWRNTYENMKEIGLIEFETTSFLRGRSFHNAVIVFDEMQNESEQVIDTVITRTGKDSRLILSGDGLQSDINNSGFGAISKILNKMKSFTTINFELNDIVRSGTAKEYLIAKYSK